MLGMMMRTATATPVVASQVLFLPGTLYLVSTQVQGAMQAKRRQQGKVDHASAYSGSTCDQCRAGMTAEDLRAYLASSRLEPNLHMFTNPLYPPARNRLQVLRPQIHKYGRNPHDHMRLAHTCLCVALSFAQTRL